MPTPICIIPTVAIIATLIFRSIGRYLKVFRQIFSVHHTIATSGTPMNGPWATLKSCSPQSTVEASLNTLPGCTY